MQQLFQSFTFNSEVCSVVHKVELCYRYLGKIVTPFA